MARGKPKAAEQQFHAALVGFSSKGRPLRRSRGVDVAAYVDGAAVLPVKKLKLATFSIKYY